MREKRPIKISPVLICLGNAVEIESDEKNHYRWRKTQTKLYCNPNGHILVCWQHGKPKTTSEEKFKRAVSANKSQVSLGVKTYEKWHEFGACSGSLEGPPRGFLFLAGRAKSIVYASDKWVGKVRSYIHEFTHPPKIWVNKDQDPSLVVLTGGKIRITQRGIEG